jgi:hypothetical protein
MHKREKHATIKHENYSSDIVFNIHEEVAARGGAVGLRHCATSRKVTGSIPDGVTGIFH